MKMSQVIIDFAGDYIDLGNSLEDRQSYLNAACAAWNIALLPLTEQDKSPKQFLAAYKKGNPGINDTDNLRQDMKVLITSKHKLFSEIKQPIANARIQENENSNQYNIVVASYRD